MVSAGELVMGLEVWNAQRGLPVPPSTLYSAPSLAPKKMFSEASSEGEERREEGRGRLHKDFTASPEPPSGPGNASTPSLALLNPGE